MKTMNHEDPQKNNTALMVELAGMAGIDQ